MPKAFFFAHRVPLPLPIVRQNKGRHVLPLGGGMPRSLRERADGAGEEGGWVKGFGGGGGGYSLSSFIECLTVAVRPVTALPRGYGTLRPREGMMLVNP